MNINIANTKGIDTIFKAKQEFHKNRAKIPFEEKIVILVKLQQIAKNIPRNLEIKKQKRISLPVWTLN